MRYFSIETNTLSFQLKFNFLNFCLLYFETDPNPLDSLSREMPGKSSMDQADPIMSTLHKEDVEADDWEINGKYFSDSFSRSAASPDVGGAGDVCGFAT